MAGEDNQNPSATISEKEAPQGNSVEARLPSGELKDQNSTPPSGTETKTNSDGSPEAKPSDKSFLNRDPEKKEEPKADDDKKPPEGEQKDGDKDAPKPEGAPEKYADFKLPDGYKLDDKTLEAATAAFKELNLTQDGAQKLIDIYTANGISAAEAPYKLWADTQKQWVTEIQESFGEAKADAMRGEINKGIDAAFTPKQARAFREALDFTGAGSNPAMFEAFNILFKPYNEGTPVGGGKPSAEGQKAPNVDRRPSVAEALYPHLVGNRAQ